MLVSDDEARIPSALAEGNFKIDMLNQFSCKENKMKDLVVLSLFDGMGGEELP